MAIRVFFPNVRAVAAAGVLVAGMMAGSTARSQVTGSTTTSTDAQGKPQESVTLSAPLNKTKKQPKSKADKVVASKDTKRSLRNAKKVDPLANADSKLPDKQLYDKAQFAIKKGRYDVARLDLQTLLNTYPDSQYQMRAKLSIANSWYSEGGTAALTQAEQEYKDFITFFPNAPEAAEAQMRVGDIYFRQMDKPDRDYAKAVHAEEEYRLMLQQFPESTLVPRAKQRLREVQEVLATRESSIGSYYATRDNWPATIARYQTVADTYPQFSHMDDVLIGMGDAYEAEARYVRGLKMAEGPKAKLERTYDERAADAYRKVVLEHSASAHVEDAKDRLAAMNLPIPTPTADQLAMSTALENSRGQYSLAGRAKLLVFHTPDVIPTATAGEPTVADPKPTLAPEIRKQIIADFSGALNPGVPVAGGTPAAAPAPATTADATPAGDVPAAAPMLSDVPAAGAAGGGAVMTTGSSAGVGGRAGGNSIGAEVVSPSGNLAPLGSAADVPRSDGTGGGITGGLPIAGPANSAPLPPVERAGEAPSSVNDVQGVTTPGAQTPAANGKNKKPEFDKSDESSSKHRKKKGLKKLNPL